MFSANIGAWSERRFEATFGASGSAATTFRSTGFAGGGTNWRSFGRFASAAVGSGITAGFCFGSARAMIFGGSGSTGLGSGCSSCLGRGGENGFGGGLGGGGAISGKRNARILGDAISGCGLICGTGRQIN